MPTGYFAFPNKVHKKVSCSWRNNEFNSGEKPGDDRKLRVRHILHQK